MKKSAILVLASIIVIGITANAVWAEDALRLSERLVVKDGETAFKRTVGFETSFLGDMEDYHISAQNINWEWYTPEEFEYVIMVAREPNKRVNLMRPPDVMYDYLNHAMQLGAERDKKILQQTVTDIKKGIKVSKPIHILITTDGLHPNHLACASMAYGGKCNFVGWANWYVYSYTFTDKAGKEVDLGIYETRGSLFNALKFYCDKEVTAGRMTKREANRFYRGLAHNVRNCDEVPLSDKLLNFRNLYNPYLYKPKD